MKAVVIIGFNYTNSKINTLPGIPIDINNVYKTFKKSQPDKTIVVTDIKSNMPIHYFYQSIKDGHVTSSVSTFIDYVQKTKEYLLCSNVKTFFEFMNNFMDDVKYITLYFTGHCVNGKIMFPSGEEYSITEIIKNINNRINKDGYIFALFDCCEYTTNFPFCYSIDHGKHIYNKNGEFIPNNIIVMGNKENKNVPIDRHGSNFTKLILENINIKSIEEFNKIIPSAGIYVNTCKTKYIWPWVTTDDISDIKILEDIQTVILDI